VSRLLVAGLALALAACTTPLAIGDRLYQDGDRLSALETWRAIPESSPEHGRARDHIAEVEQESELLIVRYKQRGRYFEERERYAESILNYRLALKLQPDDAETLSRVQQLARTLSAQKTELRASWTVAFERGDLAAARGVLTQLRSLDPFDPELESDAFQLQDALRAEVARRLAEGRSRFVAGDHDRARRAFRAVLALDPENESARGYLSYIATMRRESSATERPAAIAPAERFASDSEIRAEGFYQNALAAERSGDPYAAIRLDLRALRANDAHRAARVHLAKLRRQLAGRVDSLIEEGREAFSEEDLQSALDLWRRALLVDPGNERTRAYIARAEHHLQNLERMRSEPDVASPGS
jgi:tetratricopeptide (TPR) repeat protein